LQQDVPGEYVIATGTSRSVRDLVAAAFSYVGLDWDQYVRVDPDLVRPPEPIELVGDPTLAREKLGWEPRTSFEELVRMMVDNDLTQMQEEAERNIRPSAGI
jgi:GDPmannose 4,6-dehydratase